MNIILFKKYNTFVYLKGPSVGVKWWSDFADIMNKYRSLIETNFGMEARVNFQF